LQFQHIVEAASPRRKRSLIPKDEVIPPLPNAPYHQGQNFHEKIVAKGILGVLNHREEVKLMIPMETHITSAVCTERTAKQQMISRLLTLQVTQSADKVLSGARKPFLLKMFFELILSLKTNHTKILNFLPALDCQIQLKAAGG
jgi:hypothetical protein